MAYRSTAIEQSAGGGGGAVSSVNGATGDVVITPASIGALPAANAVTSVNGEVGDVLITKESLGVRMAAATVTVPNTKGGAFEHTQTIVDATMLFSNTVTVSLASVTDSDENDPEMLDVSSVAALAKDGEVDITLTFPEQTSGPIKLNYMVV